MLVLLITSCYYITYIVYEKRREWKGMSSAVKKLSSFCVKFSIFSIV